ncbi:UNVERIFIED_CONTAM: hypothetical protein K2H54_015723 [Gekko kuhli]
MSQRQQQQSAVQHAVRQALSPVSSLRRSSTTYTAEGKDRTRPLGELQPLGKTATQDTGSEKGFSCRTRPPPPPPPLLIDNWETSEWLNYPLGRNSCREAARS